MYRKNGLKLINLFFGERPGEILQLSNRIPVKPWYKHGRTYIPDKSTVGENLVENGAEVCYFLDSFLISIDEHFINRWGDIDYKVAMRDPKWEEYTNERAIWYAQPLFDLIQDEYGTIVVLDTLAHNALVASKYNLRVQSWKNFKNGLSNDTWMHGNKYVIEQVNSGAYDDYLPHIRYNHIWNQGIKIVLPNDMPLQGPSAYVNMYMEAYQYLLEEQHTATESLAWIVDSYRKAKKAQQIFFETRDIALQSIIGSEEFDGETTWDDMDAIAAALIQRQDKSESEQQATNQRLLKGQEAIHESIKNIKVYPNRFDPFTVEGIEKYFSVKKGLGSKPKQTLCLRNKKTSLRTAMGFLQSSPEARESDWYLPTFNELHELFRDYDGKKLKNRKTYDKYKSDLRKKEQEVRNPK